MALGGMLGGLGKLAESGAMDGIMEKLEELGIDASVIENLDLDAITSMLSEKGIDLSMLEGLGISVEDVVAKLKG